MNRVVDVFFYSWIDSNSHASASSEMTTESRPGFPSVANTVPTKGKDAIVYPHVSIDEILKNASVIRLNYYDNLPYPYVNYSYGSTFCYTYRKEMPKTTATVLKRSYMKIKRE